MNPRHWTDEELLEHLYGVGPRDGHLDGCPECRGRWTELAERRRQVWERERRADESPAARAFFARQRLAILRRAGERGGWRAWTWTHLRLASAMAAVAVLVLAVFLYRPGQAPLAPAPRPGGDQQLMTEVSAMVDTPVPSSVAAIKGLFEEDEED